METQTPKKSGYSMPAEWEKHEATWAVFPHNENTWPERLEIAQKAYAEMVAQISTGERVELLVRNERIKKLASELIFAHRFAVKENVRFHTIETMDSWIRDAGPTFVVNRKEKKLAMVEWIFNAWGMKYEHEEPLSADKIVPGKLNEILKLKKFSPGIVMEGGSVEVNGKGIVITTEQCLLNKNRNPKLKREEIENYLLEYLGANKVIWLGEGIEGDDTDGHVDDIARFVNEKTVLCCMPDESDEKNYSAMAKNKEKLVKAGLKVMDLPMPGKLMVDGVDGKKRRLPASYANFYISNAAVIVPIFGVENDMKALGIIAAAFPGRKIVGIRSTEVVFGFGAYHCMTQQQPSV
ncbi:Agmatine deiminase [Candidatus Gugararchaeum adminiculabundum]|nr:Agmatine deiminase [Candidatus Gugararchaeum adminiculabundum]